jgi:hemoglobin-like flavoprotein
MIPLGARHAGYGAVPHYYEIIGETLLWTLARGLGSAFEPKFRAAWVKLYELLAETMQTAAGATERVAPPVGSLSSRRHLLLPS